MTKKITDNLKQVIWDMRNINQMTHKSIAEYLRIPRQTVTDFLNGTTHKEWHELNSSGVIGKPKILILDIETSPVLGNVWRLFKQNVGLNQIEKDWYVLSWSAKWYGVDDVMYMDKRDSWDNEDDTELMVEIHKLIDEADWVVTQNGVNFDMKKLNARFLFHGMKPPSRYTNIDTLLIAKRYFGFTSNKLEYMTDKFCKKYKKLKHNNFAGFELWKECLKGNPEAWGEMELYNRFDVLSLEELYDIMKPWYKQHPNLNHFTNSTEDCCGTCGSTNISATGFTNTGVGKWVLFTCECGAETRGRINLYSKEKRQSLRVNVT